MAVVYNPWPGGHFCHETKLVAHKSAQKNELWLAFRPHCPQQKEKVVHH